MTINWDHIEQWEDEQDYKEGYNAAVAGKLVPPWASDAFRDGHNEGRYEREARLEAARDARAKQRREQRYNRKVEPRRAVTIAIVAAPVLRKRTP